MKGLREFAIPFVGLKQGTHKFEYEIDKKFFEHFNFEDFLDAKLRVDLSFEKKSTLLELNFSVGGSVTIPCDITNELFEQEIRATLPLIVKFGDVFNDDDDKILILPRQESRIDVSQYIYEMVVLAVPAKRVHPMVLEGSIKSKALEKLEKMRISSERATDPRWDKLKNIIT